MRGVGGGRGWSESLYKAVERLKSHGRLPVASIGPQSCTIRTQGATFRVRRGFSSSPQVAVRGISMCCSYIRPRTRLISPTQRWDDAAFDVRRGGYPAAHSPISKKRDPKPAR
jgi:hypothetical protein